MSVTWIVRKIPRAFSLVEMVAATTILSMGVMTICTLSTRSVTRIAQNRRREMAWDVMDRQFAMINYVGIDAFMEAGQMEGVLGSDDSPLGKYNWNGQVNESDIAGLYRLSMVIYWGPEGHKHKISAVTLMTGTPTEYAQDELEESGGQNSGQNSSASGSNPK